MTNPKLALIPSGYNDSIVYSILPSDGSGDFTFDRGDSATRVNKDGLIETVSEDYCRLDWLNSDCPSLLLENQSTNTQTYSESSTGKSLTGSTLTNDKAISPTGEYNAMELKEDTSTGKHRFFTGNVTVVDGTTYTLSLFVKKNSDNRFIFINAGSLIGVSGSFNLDTQAVTGGVQLFETYPNGWYRIGITEEASADVTNGYFVQLQQGTTDASYTGDESSVFVWGLQFEEGNLSSYIPNLATGSTSRSAETCSVTTPTGVTQIVETFSDDTTNTITSIPATYTVSSGKVKKVIMT
jgi:ribosomal protein L31